MNQGKFKGRGKEILGEGKPTSLNAFLQETEDTVTTEARHDGITETRENGIMASRLSEGNGSKSERTVREEFRCPPELSERFNRYVFEQKKKKRSTSKTDVVNEALEAFLAQKGY